MSPRLKRAAVLVLASVTVAGCYTLDDVRGGPVVWSASYAGQFDTMANCIAGLYGDEFTPMPLLYQREQRATVVLRMSTAVMGEFQIRQASPDKVDVSFQFVGGRPGGSRSHDRIARERADRCGGVAT